jgi:hypothetical protein
LLHCRPADLAVPTVLHCGSKTHPSSPTPNRNWHLKDELHKRDRELAKLVVRIMSLQEVLTGLRRGPVTRYTTTSTTTTTHAAFTGFARSMAYL